MSQNNETTTPVQQPQNSPKKNNSIIYWVVILILVAGCVYLFMSKNEMAEINKKNLMTIDSVKTDRASIQSDFDAASAKIDQLVSDNAKMDSALQGNKEEMAKLRGHIKSILANKNATKAELAKAREMITSLTDKTKEYESRIAELEKENATLTGQNTTLTHERDSTVSKNIALKKIGSVLHASNIRMEPIHTRRNGKEKETTKARRVDVLRIMFDIDENRIAESGTKQIYLRMIAPDGTILGNPANTSGMMNTSNGGKLGYSVEKDLAITQNEMLKDIALDWKQEGDYKTGDYTIEVYNEGFKIGGGKVTLK